MDTTEGLDVDLRVISNKKGKLWGFGQRKHNLSKS